jgi:glycosyltransferase involved in cell wall biosynthesis
MRRPTTWQRSMPECLVGGRNDCARRSGGRVRDVRTAESAWVSGLKRGVRNRRVFFVQVADPALYPPLIHAAALMADAGWDVSLLSSPIAGKTITMTPHPRVMIDEIRARPSHVVGKLDYAAYCAAAARLALHLRPDVVYASDPLGAGPALLAARLAKATLVYHEHDSPRPGALNPIAARLRAAATRSARLIVFPNEERARVVQTELGFADDRLHVVWNVPRRAEIVSPHQESNSPLILHYHGNISPQLVPIELRTAIARMAGRVRLRIAGYEAPSARGYISHLVGGDAEAGAPIEYIGMLSRAGLLKEAARAHIGLALMPSNSGNLNMRLMTGASNKAFDYMAAGLALLVSDLPDWKTMFVDTGFGLACDPTDADSLSAALGWLIDHPEKRRAMAARAQNKIEAEWNYDTQFRAVLDSLESTKSKYCETK